MKNLIKFDEMPKLNLHNLLIFLIVLLPPALISGPAIPDIIISIIGIIFIYISFQKKLTYFYTNPYSIFFFFFYFILLISSSLSEMPKVSLIDRESVFYFRFFIFSLAVCYISQIYKEIFKYLAISLFITILIITVDGSVEYFRGISLFGVKSGESRLLSLFIDEPIVGRYISSATMLCVALLIHYYGYTNNKIIVFIFSVLALGEVFTFMSGERAAFGMIASYSIAGFILINQRRLERFIFIILSVILIGTLLISEPRSQNRYQQTVTELTEKNFPFILSSPIHEMHYKSAILMFKDNPWFGIGSNLFRHMCDREQYKISDRSCTTHPHHYYIQILSENGIVGLTFILIFLLFLSFSLIKHFLGLIIKNDNWKIDDQNLLFYIFLFSMICPIWPSGSFYHNWTNIPFFIGLGFFLKFFIVAKKII